MATRNEKQWLAAAVAVWAIAMVGIVVLVFYFHRRSQDILNSLVADDPSTARQALLHRLQADRLVNEALLKHEELTSGTTGPRTSETVLVVEVVPLLEEAERLYLESLDEDSSQPGVLFHLGEVNSLMGRRARAARFISKYLETQGEKNMGAIFREEASRLGLPAPNPSDRQTSNPRDLP